MARRRAAHSIPKFPMPAATYQDRKRFSPTLADVAPPPSVIAIFLSPSDASGADGLFTVQGGRRRRLQSARSLSPHGDPAARGLQWSSTDEGSGGWAAGLLGSWLADRVPKTAFPFRYRSVLLG